MNLAIDLNSLCDDVFSGFSMKSVDKVVIEGSFKLRRILMSRDLLDLRFTPSEGNPTIPRTLDLPAKAARNALYFNINAELV